jgi:hypothetical protein
VFGYGGSHTGLPNFLITYHKVDSASDMDALYRAYRQAGPSSRPGDGARALAVADGIRTPKFGYERTATETRRTYSPARHSVPARTRPLWADAKAKIAALQASGKANARAGRTVAGGDADGADHADEACL